MKSLAFTAQIDFAFCPQMSVFNGT